MADFEATTKSRDARAVKRLGALGAFAPVTGDRVEGIYLIIEPGVIVQADFGESDVPQTLATVYKPDVVELNQYDKLEKGVSPDPVSTYTIRRVLQDDGQVATCVVV